MAFVIRIYEEDIWFTYAKEYAQAHTLASINQNACDMCVGWNFPSYCVYVCGKWWFNIIN